MSWDTLIVGLFSNENSINSLIGIFDSIVALVAAIVGAIVAAIVGAYYYKKSDRDRRKIEKTIDFIDEFYSKEFIMHRRVLWNTQLKVQDNNNTKASIENIALGFLYPIPRYSKPYDGEMFDDLTEHNHISMYLGFLERLSLSIKKKYVDVNSIKEAFSDAMIWHAELILKICDSIEYNAQEQKRKHDESASIKNDKGLHGRLDLTLKSIKNIKNLHDSLDLTRDKLASEISYEYRIEPSKKKNNYSIFKSK